MMERVVVQLHVGGFPEAVVKKVWRFDTSSIEQYDWERLRRINQRNRDRHAAESAQQQDMS